MGGSGVLSLRPFGLVLLIPWAASVPNKLARRKMVSAGAMLRDRLGPPGRCRGCWPHDGAVAGGAVAELRFIDFRVPAITLLLTLYAREGAAGQAVVCPLLRGSSPTRAVAPKQHGGLRRAFSPAFRAGSLDPLGRVGAEQAGAAKIGFGRRGAARPARAAWAVPRLLAARWRGRRRRRRRVEVY